MAADESGHGRGKRVDDVPDPRARGVEGTADEQGWLQDGGAVVGGKVLPVPVDVAITVQCSREAGAFELLDVNVQVVIAEPPGVARSLALRREKHLRVRQSGGG